MPDYLVSFAGLHVRLWYDTAEAHAFLEFLFQDVQGAAGVRDVQEMRVVRQGEDRQYVLVVDDNILVQGKLGVRFAAVLFDAVLFHLLQTNRNGILFHAGAVSYRDKLVLLPGSSGSGKSTLTAQLISRDCSYLTDELYFVSENEPVRSQSFTRPVCLKSGAVPFISPLIRNEDRGEILAGEAGMIIPHRILNRHFSPVSSMPSLILFPEYREDASCTLEWISSARACAALMACNVNGRNYSDHGFQQIVRLARSIPACRITYGGGAFPDILHACFSPLTGSS